MLRRSPMKRGPHLDPETVLMRERSRAIRYLRDSTRAGARRDYLSVVRDLNRRLMEMDR